MNNRKGIPEISVIIPAFNEGKRLPSTLPFLYDYLRKKFEVFEIIIVNDGSTDDTVNLVLKYMQIIPELKLLNLEVNRGKGFAVRVGVEAANGKLILFSDADLSTPPTELKKLISALNEGNDIAIGSRATKDAYILKYQPKYRMLMGKIFNHLVKCFAISDFSDTQCGFKCFRSQIAKEIFSLSRIDGFTFDVEILLIARNKNFAIKEVGISWRNATNSKVDPIKHSLQMATDLIKIIINDFNGVYRAEPRKANREASHSFGILN